MARAWASRGGTLFNEINENPLPLRHSNVDRIDIATTPVGFLLEGNDSLREISRFGNSEDHTMSKSEGTSHPSVLEFVPLKENIAGISNISRQVDFTGIHLVFSQCSVTVYTVNKGDGHPSNRVTKLSGSNHHILQPRCQQ